MKLKQIVLDKVRSVIIRAEWHESGENATKYFLSQAQKKACDNTIRGIKTVDGTVVTETQRLLAEHVNFYQNLYQKAPTEQSAQNICLNSLQKQLTPKARESCEGSISLEQC